jgi:hypothetical protein
MDRIDSVTNPRAMIASGGFCAPLAADYRQINISGADRPVRDSLAQFNANRGGIRFMPPVTLAQVAGGITVWTNTNDITPSSPATKGYVTVACGTETDVVLEAITQQVKFGNLGARAFPERVADVVALLAAQHARIAEVQLLTTMGTNSIAVNTGQDFGTTRDVLAHLDQAIAGYRYRNRTAAEMPLQLIIPEWLDDNMRADLARETPGASAERLAEADASINEFYRVRGVNVTRALDDVSTPAFNGQNAGDLQPWPSTAVLYLFHAGAHVFLDGGVLDLGVVRDSTLNSTNDYMLFSESFEGLATPGVESLKITMDICPSGLSQAPTFLDVCVAGS